jgi:hypothetical protein
MGYVWGIYSSSMIYLLYVLTPLGMASSLPQV